MGSKGFWAFFASIIKKIPLSKLKGKPLFVDAMLYIYKFIIGIRNSGSDIKNKSGKNITHLYAIYNLVKNYISEDILPIFVFDGHVPEIKKKEIERRHKDIVKAQKNLDNFGKVDCDKIDSDKMDSDKSDKTDSDIDTENIEVTHNIDNEFNTYIKNFKRSFSLSTNMIQECKMFLDLMGIPHCTAYEEADSQCASLAYYYNKFTNGVVSEDSDIMIFGSPQLIRDIDFKSSNKFCNIIFYDDVINYLQSKTDQIRKELNLERLIFTKENFIDFTIIMGNDYNNGIRCSGGNSATNRELLFKLFVKNDLKIENFIGCLYIINKKLNKIKFYIPENFITKTIKCRLNYKYANIYEPSDINIYMNKPNYDGIKKIMTDNDFILGQITSFIKDLSGIFRFFSKAKTIKNDDNQNSNEWIEVIKRK